VSRRTDLGGWAALSTCLLVVAGISLGGQRVAELTSAKHVAAEVGTTAPTRLYAVRAERVVVARAVHTGAVANGSDTVGFGSDNDTLRRTASGVFVVVRWTASGATEPVPVPDARLVTADGRTFAPRVGLGQPVGPNRLVQPGFASSWTTVFDVPPQLVPGAELVVPPVTWEAPLYDITVHVQVASSAVVDDAVAEPDEVRLHRRSADEVAHRGGPRAREHTGRRLLGGDCAASRRPAQGCQPGCGGHSCPSRSARRHARLADEGLDRPSRPSHFGPQRLGGAARDGSDHAASRRPVGARLGGGPGVRCRLLALLGM